MKEKVLAFLKSKPIPLCVLATVSVDGKAECAMVGYVVLDDFTLLISTNKKSRKWQNVKFNPSVAVSVGSGFEEPNMQYEGEATLIEDGDMYQETDKVFFEKAPHAKKFRSPDTVFIKIQPKWIRVSDFSTDQHTIEEFRF